MSAVVARAEPSAAGAVVPEDFSSSTGVFAASVDAHDILEARDGAVLVADMAVLVVAAEEGGGLQRLDCSALPGGPNAPESGCSAPSILCTSTEDAVGAPRTVAIAAMAGSKPTRPSRPGSSEPTAPPVRLFSREGPVWAAWETSSLMRVRMRSRHAASSVVTMRSICSVPPTSGCSMDLIRAARLLPAPTSAAAA